MWNGLRGPVAATVKSRNCRIALTMRPGSSISAAIGDSGCGGAGVVTSTSAAAGSAPSSGCDTGAVSRPTDPAASARVEVGAGLASNRSSWERSVCEPDDARVCGVDSVRGGFGSPAGSGWWSVPSSGWVGSPESSSSGVMPGVMTASVSGVGTSTSGVGEEPAVLSSSGSTASGCWSLRSAESMSSASRSSVRPDRTGSSPFSLPRSAGLLESSLLVSGRLDVVSAGAEFDPVPPVDSDPSAQATP